MQVGKSSSRWAGLAAVALVAIGVVRILATYHDFNQAYDEPAHIACGMEWLDKGTFSMEPQHPPLPRVMSALGPYLAGLRLPEVGFVGGDRANGYDFYGAGNQILYARGKYLHNLTLARLGTLPFFVFSSWITFVWARSLLGDWPAVVAVFLLTTLPVVLGYSSLAYVDPALMAMFPAALLALVRWLEAPGWGRSAVLGAAVAGMALANAPWMAFFPPCVVGILVCWWWGGRGVSAGLGWKEIADRSVRATLALVVAGLVVWGGYRFSVERLDTVFENPGKPVEHLHLSSPVKTLALKVIAINPWLPAPAFFQGVGRAIGENSKLYPAYLFGKVKRGGWWYFYFFMLAFKTAPGFVLLAVVGGAWGLRRFWSGRDWRVAVPAVCVVVILLVGMTIKVNLGVRTILFIYPLMAILGAVACREILDLCFGNLTSAANAAMQNGGIISGLKPWAVQRPWHLTVLVGLGAVLVWLVADGVALHPNYLTYTSALAGRPPDYSLVLDADFDAGQNVLRLAEVLRERNIQHLKLRLYTSADLSQMGLPPFEVLAPYEKATGWVAVSVHNLRTGEGPWYPLQADGYAWLNAYPAVESPVEKTIRLVWVPES
jgi:4-amino-4-deoxy-L-arabinose transferase-like glycosyltransferase